MTLLDEPLEQTIEAGPGNTTGGVSGLLAGLTLGDPLGTDLDTGLTEGLDHGDRVNTEALGNLPWDVSFLGGLAFSLVVTTLGLVLNLAAAHDTSSDLHAVPGLILREANDVEGIHGVLKLLIVVDRGDGGLTLGDKAVKVDVVTKETLFLHVGHERLKELVEDVVGPLHLLLLSDTGLLEKVGHDVATRQLAGSVEVDTDELTETGRVVIPGGLGITVGLQNGVGGHNLVLKRDLLLGLLATGGDNGQVGDDLLGVLSLAGTRLSSDQHSLILLVLQHATVGSLSNGPQMGWHLVPPLTKIDLGHPVGVERVTLVGVDNNHEETRVGVDHLALVAGLQVPEDASIVEEGQVDHVLALLELGRVDLAHLSPLQSELLVSHGHLALAAGILQVSRLQDTLAVAAGLGVRDPDRLLGIVGLALVGPLDLQGGQKELGGVGVHRPGLGQLDMARHDW